jgi:hypothetical protein
MTQQDRARPGNLVTIVCVRCSVRITGKLNKRGELRAARQPNNSASEIPGWCMSCAPHSALTGKVISFDTDAIKGREGTKEP